MQTALILPELASGRGTSRRSRMVEGQTPCCFSQDEPKHGVGVIEKLDSRDA